MTAFVLSGMIGWAIFTVMRALLTNKGLKSVITPEPDWGPLLMEHKRLAVHLENLEPYHDSKRVKKETKLVKI